jgi:IS30 family transposase
MLDQMFQEILRRLNKPSATPAMSGTAGKEIQPPHRLRGMMEMGLSICEIARRLGQHGSTVLRELERNRCADGYRSDSAGRRAWARKLRGSKIVRSTRLRAHVEDRLAMGWSPEQIAGRMELDGPEHAISAASIYRHVYSPAGRRAGLPRMLAQRKPKRGRRRRNGRREPAIPNRTPIHQRPTRAHLRGQFGHWEGDLMHFRCQRAILLTLQERRSRLTLARRVHGKDADLTAHAAELGGLPATAPGRPPKAASSEASSPTIVAMAGTGRGVARSR